MKITIFNELFRNMRKRSRRKNPLKMDEHGRSARKRAFQAFSKGLKPEQVFDNLDISIATAKHYYRAWKELPDNYKENYEFTKWIMKKYPDFAREFIRKTAQEYQMSESAVIEQLEKPWGLYRLLRDKLKNYSKQESQDRFKSRFEAALRLVRFIELSGMSPEELKVKLQQLIKEASHNRPIKSDSFD